MTPIEALGFLEQVAASAPMPLAMHNQAKQAIRTLVAAIQPKQEEKPDGDGSDGK